MVIAAGSMVQGYSDKSSSRETITLPLICFRRPEIYVTAEGFRLFAERKGSLGGSHFFE